MSCAGGHTIHAHQVHKGWDNAFEPVMTVAPGETVEFETIDASGGQLTPDSVASDVPNLSLADINPVTGPIYIDGAEPGDAVKVTFESFQASGWGWTALIPGFGLLAHDFPDPALTIWRYDAQNLGTAAFGPGGQVPLKPFCGTVGLAPGAPGLHSIVPPRRVGGNMDIRDLAVGTELYLPVEVAGGLLSLGDTHAAQGDGEVCGTAIESPMRVAATIDLVKDTRLPAPQFVTPGPVSRHFDVDGYTVTTGVNSDLMVATQDAVRAMIDRLTKHQELSAPDAYMLVSTCADLRISEVVDQPNWVVSFYFPNVVFN